ncbi:hypothetical protein C8Q76DRAFT_802837 [Earliella scabrosa]|nr:hypothetical protein C8Q76DRAFT_802837 [Earliella scabrosa]
MPMHLRPLPRSVALRATAVPATQQLPTSAHKLIAIMITEPAISACMADNMDTPTLVAWRACSSTTYEHACESLSHRLHALVKLFTPKSARLLRLVTQTHTVIGGEFALAHVLGDRSIIPDRLDIFASDEAFHTTVHALMRSPSLSPLLSFLGVRPFTRGYASHRGVDRVAIFAACRKRLILVHHSNDHNSFSPITREWTTALFNFVTEYSLGCAYPRLTFTRRALVSEPRTYSLTNSDIRTLGLISGAGFAFASHPALWEEYKHLRPALTPPGTFPCARRLFICPDQGRCFGDAGSWVQFAHPLGNDIAAARTACIAPFGRMAAWRLLTIGGCDENCVHDDALVPAGAIVIATALDPYASFETRENLSALTRACPYVPLPRRLRNSRARSSSV